MGLIPPEPQCSVRKAGYGLSVPLVLQQTMSSSMGGTGPLPLCQRPAPAGYPGALCFKSTTRARLLWKGQERASYSPFHRQPASSQISGGGRDWPGTCHLSLLGLPGAMQLRLRVSRPQASSRVGSLPHGCCAEPIPLRSP